MTEPVNAVLFDLDNTLCEYPLTDDELLDDCFVEANVEPFFEATDYHELLPEYIDECEDASELRRRCFVHLAHERDRDPTIGRAVAERYTANRAPDSVTFTPGVPAVIDRLADSVKLGLVTNGERESQTTKLKSLGIHDRFETTVFASDEVTAKPAAEPFERALADLDVSFENAVYVGDSLESDVAGANRCGMRSVWVIRDSESLEIDVEPTWSVETVGELPDVLPDV